MNGNKKTIQRAQNDPFYTLAVMCEQFDYNKDIFLPKYPIGPKDCGKSFGKF